MDGRVYYGYDRTIDSVKQGKIYRALDTLEGLTSLQFAPMEMNATTLPSDLGLLMAEVVQLVER